MKSKSAGRDDEVAWRTELNKQYNAGYQAGLLRGQKRAVGDRRERIALAALQGILSNDDDGQANWDWRDCAVAAVKAADALIAALDEPAS